jgi:hypothetical protein
VFNGLQEDAQQPRLIVPLTQCRGCNLRSTRSGSFFTSQVLSKIVTGPDFGVKRVPFGQPAMVWLPCRAKLIQASLTFPPSSRASAVPPIANAEKSVLLNTNGIPEQWKAGGRPFNTGVCQLKRQKHELRVMLPQKKGEKGWPGLDCPAKARRKIRRDCSSYYSCFLQESFLHYGSLVPRRRRQNGPIGLCASPTRSVRRMNINRQLKRRTNKALTARARRSDSSEPVCPSSDYL